MLLLGAQAGARHARWLPFIHLGEARGLMSSESSWDNYRFVGEQLETREKREKAKLRLKLYCGSAGKESTCNAGDLSWIPKLGRSPGEGKACPLQYSGLENSRSM